MRNKSATTLSNIVHMRIESLQQKKQQCYWNIKWRSAGRIVTGSRAKANTMTFQVLHYEQCADQMFAKDASLIVVE